MKKVVVLLFAVVGFSMIAATCINKIAITKIGGDYVFGAEFTNTTNADILGHKFAVAFLDDNGNVLQTKTVEGCLRSLQAGEIDFFSATSTEDFDDIEVAISRIAGPLTFGEVADGELTISNLNVSRNGDTVRVSGKIKNTGNVDLEDARACVVVKNDDGNVQVVARDGQTYDLDEDDDADFVIDVEVKDDNNDSDAVDVLADATTPDDDDKPIEPAVKEDTSIDECPDATNTPAATNTPLPTITPTVTNTPVPTATGTPVATNTAVPDAC